MANEKQTYQYKSEDSILSGLTDDYTLSIVEVYRLYTFYVTYSMCGSQSMKKRSIADYGWTIIPALKKKNQVNPTLSNTGLDTELKKVLDLESASFVFTDKNDLKKRFDDNNLSDGSLTDYDTERCVIGKTTQEGNKYTKLFYRIRNGFAHGRFALKYDSNHIKMVVIQDWDTKNVTGRIVLKLQTLLDFIETVDRNNIILTLDNAEAEEQVPVGV
jgi:hypothetical protein